MNTPVHTTTYTDKFDRLWKIEVYSHSIPGRLRSYIIFPKNHWILKMGDKPEKLDRACYSISRDELVFVAHNKAGYFLRKSAEQCVDIMIKTILVLENDSSEFED